jgi:hypothetical protein
LRRDDDEQKTSGPEAARFSARMIGYVRGFPLASTVMVLPGRSDICT